MGNSNQSTSDLSKSRQIFSKYAPMFEEKYAVSNDRAFIPVVWNERMNYVTASNLKSLRRTWESANKNAKIKHYIPRDNEIGWILDADRLIWTANRILTLSIDVGEMSSSDAGERREKLNVFFDVIQKTLSSCVEAYFELFRIKTANPEIERIERGKELIQNALKAKDKRALMELKLQYGGLLAKEGLYVRRTGIVYDAIKKSEEQLFENVWNLLVFVQQTLDGYSQFLFTSLQSLLNSLGTEEQKSSVMSLVSESEEVNRQSCILHDRAKQRKLYPKESASILKEISGTMNVILNQTIAMNDYMQSVIVDLCRFQRTDSGA